MWNLLNKYLKDQLNLWFHGRHPTLTDLHQHMLSVPTTMVLGFASLSPIKIRVSEGLSFNVK